MAVAQASPVADTILAQSIDGSSTPVNFPAPAFSLTDQHGQAVTLASLRGKVVLLTFLDDTCSVDCPLIAQEFRQAGQLLGADTARVELVAINYNPLNTQVSYIQAFDRQEGLAGVPNWLYLTGTPAQLQPVWRQYAIAPPEILPAGSMVGHGDYAFVIDQAGHMREELDFDTGPGNAGHQVVVRRRADRCRAAAAGALMSRPGRPPRWPWPPGRSLARVRQRRCPLRPRPARRSPAGRGAVPGHLHGHGRRHLGGRGDGRLGRPATTTSGSCSCARPGAARWNLVTPPGPRITAAWSSPTPARVADHRVPAQPVPDLYAADRHRRRRPGLVISRPARRGPGQRPRRARRRPRHRHPACPAHQRHRRAGRPGYASWTTLATQRSLAATPAGRRCGLQDLTAAAFAPPGTPLLGGSCGRPGTAGIFADTDGTWHAAGPALPAALASQPVQVLRLTSTQSGTVALLAAGTGPAASLLAAWSSDSGGHWALSPPLRLNGAALSSASFGPGDTAAIVLNGSRGEAVAGPGVPWRALPALPPGTAALAAGPAGGLDALAVDRTKMTAWQLVPGSIAWAKTQVIDVPIQFGSSS